MRIFSQAGLRRFAFAAALTSGLAPYCAQAQLFAEFPVPTPSPFIDSMTPGPDGNIWFVETAANKIGRITPAGVITEFTIPTAGSLPSTITTGPDGNLWFTGFGSNKIGRITTAGVITEFNITTANSQPAGIASANNRLWFAESAAQKVGVMNVNGTMSTEIAITDLDPRGITVGGDGNLWVAERAGSKIAKITTGGVLVSEFPIPTQNASPFEVALGADGNVWFTETGSGAAPIMKIGRITTAGVVTEFFTGSVQPGNNIRNGPDGALWFSEFSNTGKLGRMTTAGAFSELKLPSTPASITALTQGPADGTLWYYNATTNAIGRINFNTPQIGVTPSTNIAASGPVGGLFAPTSFTYTLGIVTGTVNYTITGVPTWLDASSTSGTITLPGTNVTFTVNASANSLPPGTHSATITITNTTNGNGNRTINATLKVAPPTTIVSAVLPASRSVKIFVPATAFATIINAGSAVGLDCALSLSTALNVAFSYQTTNPATNAVNGTANTPVDIAAGQAQSYVFSITPSATFAATDLPITAKCTNSPAASSVVGLNTLLMSSSSSIVPDIVALAASVDPGYVDLPGNSGTGAFSVATVNVGATGSITATADTGATSLPVSIALCQTNASAQCVNPSTPAASATLTINANDTPTFSIFVTGSGAVANDPAGNRVFVRFKDGSGNTRGATSVAVRTQ